MAQGSIRDVHDAEEVAAKAKSALRGGDYAPEIVVMEGQPDESPKFLGSYRPVCYVRSIISPIDKEMWRPAVL